MRGAVHRWHGYGFINYRASFAWNPADAAAAAAAAAAGAVSRGRMGADGKPEAAKQDAASAKAAQYPDAAVHIAPARWNADLLALAPADNAAVVPFAYQTMAARYGFAIEPATSRRVSATCPTLFWAEQGQRHVSSAADILRDVRGDGFAVSILTVRRIGDGWIAEGR